MFACCGRPAAASFGDRFTNIVSTMRVKRSPKSARWGPPSRRRPSVSHAPGRRIQTVNKSRELDYSNRVQRLLEAIGVGALGLRQRLKPISDFGKAFIASLLRHARVHVGVL